MASFAEFSRLSPLPVVNLADIDSPVSGIAINTPVVCVKHFRKGNVCKQHYERLARGDLNAQLIQCPYGFTSYAIRLNSAHVAFTGVIPFPREGGSKEREAAKQNKDNKIATAKFIDAAVTLKELEKRMMVLDDEATKRYSFALHEIRKLNRTIKQEAERICISEAPNDPDKADPALVKIWKSAELMSMQFDNIEFLANEHVFTLQPDHRMQLYRLVHKVVRIFQPNDNPKIQIDPTYGFDARIHACDKTIHILPTVLIENALKYSLADERIYVRLFYENGQVVLTVDNVCKGGGQLSDKIFGKGFRASSDKEGSGNGLYLAKRVAQQHGGTLIVESSATSRGSLFVRFRFAVPEAR